MMFFNKQFFVLQCKKIEYIFYMELKISSKLIECITNDS